MLDIFLSKLKLLFKSPMIVFIYGIISQWYIMIMVTAVVVLYWVLKGLTEAGVLQEAETVVSKALLDTKSVARYCVPKILTPTSFWECLQHPRNYEPTEEEKTFEGQVKDLLNFGNYNQAKDPYSTPDKEPHSK